MKKRNNNLWEIRCNGETVHHTNRPGRFLMSEAARKISRDCGSDVMSLRCIGGPKRGESYDYGL